MANNNLINSVVKATDVLRLVGESDGGMRLGEIAEALGMKAPAAHNLLRTLIARGFLEKRNNHHIHIGPALLDIAAKQESGSLTAAAEKVLRHLYDVIPSGVTVFGVATSLGVRQTLRISPDRPQVLQHLPGDSFHLYASAAGLVGLAFANETELMHLEERYPFAEYGAHLWQSRQKLNDFLSTARRRRVVICPFNSEQFLRVSVPILDRTKRLTGVIGVSIQRANLTGNLNEDFIIEQIKKAVGELGGERSRLS